MTRIPAATAEGAVLTIDLSRMNNMGRFRFIRGLNGSVDGQIESLVSDEHKFKGSTVEEQWAEWIAVWRDVRHAATIADRGAADADAALEEANPRPRIR